MKVRTGEMSRRIWKLARVNSPNPGMVAAMRSFACLSWLVVVHDPRIQLRPWLDVAARHSFDELFLSELEHTGRNQDYEILEY